MHERRPLRLIEADAWRVVYESECLGHTEITEQVMLARTLSEVTALWEQHQRGGLGVGLTFTLQSITRLSEWGAVFCDDEIPIRGASGYACVGLRVVRGGGM